MARYGQAFKNKAAARLLPPESGSLETVSRERSISSATLERWRTAATQALAEPEKARASPSGTKADRRRIKEFERELHRKDKALTEAAALLVLSKNGGDLSQERGRGRMIGREDRRMTVRHIETPCRRSAFAPGLRSGRDHGSHTAELEESRRSGRRGRSKGIVSR